MRVTIGPVPSAAARPWIDNTKRIVAAIRQNPDKIPFAVPVDTMDTFDTLLDEWEVAARKAEEFVWAGESDTANIRTLVQYWVNIDSLSDEEIARLGVAWSPPEGRPFFEALVIGISSALSEEEDTADYAANVRRILEEN